MIESFDVAVVQMCSGPDKSENLETASRYVEQAARDGAQLVVLPELFNCLASFQQILSQAETIPGPTSEAMSRLARQLGITLLAGSLCEQADTANRGYNTSLLFNADGELVSRYRKIHLFDVDLPQGPSITESAWMSPGTTCCVTNTPVAKIGQATCYDLRFPELFRRLIDQGAELISVPSAFTRTTGKDHWHVLVRARAIENQVYVAAANQGGQHSPDLASFGHSLLVDPWGEILAEAKNESEQVIVATVRNERFEQIRSHVPCLNHRQLK